MNYHSYLLTVIYPQLITVLTYESSHPRKSKEDTKMRSTCLLYRRDKTGRPVDIAILVPFANVH